VIRHVGPVLLALAVGSLTLAGCRDAGLAPSAPSAPAPTPEPALTPIPDAPAGEDLGRFERVTGGAGHGDTLPLVIALHGLGDRPDRFSHLFDALPMGARVVAVQAFEPHGQGYSWFAMGPDNDRGAAIAGAADRLAGWIDAATRRYPTRGKPVVTGFSQGGMLSFAIAVRHPDLVGGAIPLGGLLPPNVWPAERPSGPLPAIRALHGAADDRVPLADAERTASKLREMGWDAQVEAFDGVGHSLSAPMRERLYALIAELAGPPPAAATP
jgi:phospholipase/carboxylesterase